MITLSHLAWACFILACLLFTAYILYFLADDRPSRQPGRHQARVNEFGPEPGEEWADELHQIGDDTGRMAALHVTGLTASAPDAPQASPVTRNLHGPVAHAPVRSWDGTRGVVEFHRTHTIEVHPRDYWAGQYRANPPAPCWPAGDGDLDESAWTKRSALDLAIDLAYDDTAAGFDQLLREIRNYGDYASSGLQERWAS